MESSIATSESAPDTSKRPESSAGISFGLDTEDEKERAIAKAALSIAELGKPDEFSET
jgi:hypothetical protein